MSINKKSLRYILYTFPVFLLCIFPLLMGCLVYSINLNSRQLDTNKGLIEYVNDYLPFNASYNDSPSLPELSYFGFYNFILANSSQHLLDSLYSSAQYSTTNNLGNVDPYTPVYNGDNVTMAGFYYYPNWRIRTSNSSGTQIFSAIDFVYVIFTNYIKTGDYSGLDSYLYSIGIVSTDVWNPSSIADYGQIGELRSIIDNYVSLVSSYHPFTIEYNNTPSESILSDVYLNLFNNLVLPYSSNLGLPYWLFNYMFYILGIFILYILFIFLIYVPKCLICLLDKSIDKLSGGNNV